jgi:hypothetical protein
MTKKPLIALLMIVSSGCSTMSHTDKGVLTGGALGGIGGALVGSAVGRPGAGAAIGAGLGAVAGGVTGSAVDRAEARADRADARAAATAAANQRPPLALHEIVAMTRNGVSDTIIINEIRQSGSTYRLTPDDIIWLKQQGVGDAVVAEMQRRPVYAAPVTYVRPRYVVIEEPPPVSVGFSYGWGGCRRW